jgi:ATP-dependent helicase/DNAse subunit B
VDGELAARFASAAARGRIERERRDAVDRREAAPHAGAIPGEELAAALPAEWTPTQLEEQARCPYRLFLGAFARLPSREAAGVEIDPRDEGGLLHAALEALVAARVARGAWPPRGDAGDREEALAVAEEVFARFERSGRTGDPAVWGARRRAVGSRLVRWIEAEARDADGLVPRLFEHRFGGGSGRPPLRFAAAGAEVAVQGRIDRVDADGRRLRVLDYKNARKESKWRALLDPETFGETSFQIPVYLAAAARELPGRERIGATIGLLRDGERLAPFEAEARQLLAGPLGERFAAAVVEAVERVRAGRFPIVSRDCDRCDYGAVCRFQGAAQVEEGADGEG